MSISIDGNNGNYNTEIFDGLDKIPDTDAKLKIKSTSLNPGADDPVRDVARNGSSENSDITDPDKSGYSVQRLSLAGAACASFFGSVLALIQQSTSELVRDNRQISYEAQMQSADSMEEQADKMRDKALAALITGIIQGTFQIAGGAVQAGMSIRSMGDVSKLVSNQPEGKLNVFQKLLNTLQDAGSGKIASDYMQNVGGVAQGVGQGIQSFATFSQATSSYLTGKMEAEIKAMEADQKRLDAFADQVKSINDSLQQTVRSAIDTSRAISQSMVETNKRILA